MTNELIIRNAISHSISHNEIVNVEIDETDTSAIHDLVSATQHEHWDYSDENDTEDGRRVLDVYSLEESPNQWRIRVTFGR